MRAKLSIEDALAMVRGIDDGLDVYVSMSPRFVGELGGRDALARRCEMTLIGPVPRLTTEEWERAHAEYVSQTDWGQC